MLAGRAEDVLPMLTGGTEDPMKSAGLDPNFQERHIHESKHMTGWKILLWGLFYLLDILWWPRMEKQLVYLPGKVVHAMKDRVNSSLADEKLDRDDSIQNVSSSDVVAAFISNLTVHQLPASSSRSAVILSPIDMRSRMPSIFPKVNGVYITNAAPIISTIVPAQVIRSPRSGMIETAKALRRSLKLQTSEDQIHALNRLERASMVENGLPAFFGDARSLVIIISDMTKAQLYNKVDFGPAVLHHREIDPSKGRERRISAENKSAAGQVAYFHMQELGGENILSRNNFLVFGTPSGGYWITGSLPAAIWAKMQEVIASLGEI
ncbi:Chloramphenicol acetyltransferase-like domain protein [Metarhizium rileyi]|uniref:Chloramphenicol acetyltransferase-like domain protein n=1 Tax=Metarhizium rileyi (strain RCEF 4871) TaxID=1649241 RepID=A0A167C2V9_METRR|nr:Chloramphenicol acetyltransferase-like domain protein [Metarhizium rileyi RCEF 4871]